MDYVLEPGLDYFYFLKVFTLKMIYNNPATTKPTNSPISPVPARAIGPTYQIWDMEGMITAKDPKNANMAGADGGNRLTLSQSCTLYNRKSFLRKTKCSARTMAAKDADQYPMIPVEL